MVQILQLEEQKNNILMPVFWFLKVEIQLIEQGLGGTMHVSERIKAAKSRIQELELLITHWQGKDSLCSDRDLESMSPKKHSEQNNDSTTV